MRKLFSMLAVALTLLAAGCGGSGGGSHEAVPGEGVNLKITNIEQPSSDAKAGYGISLVYTVSSESIANTVVTNFYILSADQSDALEDNQTSDTIEQHYIGSDTIETALVGDNVETVEFKIPENVSASGSYTILAVVDPDNMITENNENDNSYTTSDDTVVGSESDVTEESAAAVKSGRAAVFNLNIDTSYTNVSNVKIKKFELDDSTIVFDVEDYDLTNAPVLDLTQEYPQHGNAHIKGTAEIAVEGAKLTPDQLNALTIKVQIYVNGAWTDIKAWNNDTAQYSDYMTTKIVANAEEVFEGETSSFDDIPTYTVYVDAQIPVDKVVDMLNSVAANIAAATPDAPPVPDVPGFSDVLGLDGARALVDSYNTFGVRIIVDADSALAELDENDNVYEAYVKVYSLPTTARSASDYLMEKSWSKGVGDKSKARAEVNVYGKLGLVTDDIHGAVAHSEVTIPVYVFNYSKNLVEMYDHYSVYYDSPGDTGYESRLEFLDNTIYGEEKWVETSITRSLERSWNKEQTFARATFAIGPVPVTMEAGASGEVGFTFSGTLSTQNPILSSDNELPNLSMDAYASAGVGGWGFSAGAIAKLVLIDEIFGVHGSSTVTYDQANDTTVSARNVLLLQNDMESISGKFGLYVEYPTVKWCSKRCCWKTWHYPCGTNTQRRYKWYYETDALADFKTNVYDKAVDYP